MRPILSLTLITPALLAQAPAPPSAAQRAAADIKAIEALKLENPAAAFARAKTLLPAARPPFDRTSLQTAFAGIREWNSQLDLHRAAYDAGVASGRFEEARDVALKAQDVAKDLQKEALAAFNAYKTGWEKAGEESLQVLAELKALESEAEAKRTAPVAPQPDPKPNPNVSIEEANAELQNRAEKAQREAAAAKRLAFLKSNEAAVRENVEKSKKVMGPLERPIQDLEARVRGFDAAVSQWDKYLQEETEDIARKYKGDKTSYAAGLLRGVAPKPASPESALVALHRASFLDPRNPAIQKRIAQILGKTPAPSSAGKTRKRRA